MILDEFERKLEIQAGETSEDNKFTLETVNCVGACALAPVMVVDGEYHGSLEVDSAVELLHKIAEADQPPKSAGEVGTGKKKNRKEKKAPRSKKK